MTSMSVNARERTQCHSCEEDCETYLLLSIRPPRNLHNHIQDRLLLIGIQRDIMEGRDGYAILLEEDAVLERVLLPDLASTEFLRGLGVEAAAGGQRGGGRHLVSL